MSYDIARKTFMGIPKRAIMGWMRELDRRGDAAAFSPEHVEMAILVSDDWGEQARYLAMRADGESHNMAEILATGTFPGVRTDSEFLKGHCNGNQFESCPRVGDAYRAIAEAHGMSTNGLVYMRGLAEFPGDPRAWVGGRGDVARLAGERGWGVSGSVDIPRREVEPAADVAVADDIVSDYAEELVGRGMGPEAAIDHAIAVRSGLVDDYDPGDHVRPIPAEAAEFCPDFGGG